MFRIGLKLWSTNINYIPAAQVLFAQGIFDYVELFVVPGSGNAIKDWRVLNVPYVLHAPHSYAGLNPADKARRAENLGLVRQVAEFVDALRPSKVIFHPGILYDLDEAIFQLNAFKQAFPWMSEKALVENKPGLGLNGEVCLGASEEQMKRVLQETGLGFCFDVGHAICHAVLAQKPWEKVVEGFLMMQPAMFHLSDGPYSEKDKHLHLGEGQYDLASILERMPSEAVVTLETPKSFADSLDDFVKDAAMLRAKA